MKTLKSKLNESKKYPTEINVYGNRYEAMYIDSNSNHHCDLKDGNRIFIRNNTPFSFQKMMFKDGNLSGFTFAANYLKQINKRVTVREKDNTAEHSMSIYSIMQRSRSQIIVFDFGGLEVTGYVKAFISGDVMSIYLETDEI